MLAVVIGLAAAALWHVIWRLGAKAWPLPPPLDSDDPLRLPGGTGLTTTPEYVSRGVGYAISIKNIAMFGLPMVRKAVNNEKVTNEIVKPGNTMRP